MTLQPMYLRYLEAAKQAETAAELQAQGFQVQSEVAVDDVRFDLVAAKGDRSLAYEFKAGRSPKTSRHSLQRLQETAAKKGWEFRIVVVTPPPRVHIEVDTLQHHLLEHLMDHTPDSLDQLSTHTRVVGLSDVEVSDLRISGDEVKIHGTGSVDVELEYGSGSDQDSEQGASIYDSYPLVFRATFALDGQIIEVNELDVDTSSFYE